MVTDTYQHFKGYLTRLSLKNLCLEKPLSSDRQVETHYFYSFELFQNQTFQILNCYYVQ